MSVRIRAATAGIAGALVAFGVSELVHGFYQAVPSVLVSVAQRIIAVMPGGLATQAIETLGQADVPFLISNVIVATLVLCGLLAILSLGRPLAALGGVAVLAAAGLAAALSEPFVASIPTAITVVAAFALGSLVARYLTLRFAEERSGESEPEPDSAAPTGSVRSREAHSTGGMSVDRRGFLMLSGGAATAGLAAVGVGRLLGGGGAQTASAPTKLQTAGASGSGAADAVVHETLPPPPAGASLDVPGIPPLMTPAKDFYLIDSALSSPRIDRDSWKLKITGAVDNPIELSYSDLTSMSTRESDVTLSCVSNEVGGGLVSNGRWTGVMLSDVLKEAGMSPDKISRASEQLVGRSVDGWTGGFKTNIAFDGREALVAFGLNGSELPVKHGYPMRLVVPGLYGYVSATKWLTELELTNWDFDAYWIQRTWAKEGPVKTQSRIDTLSGGDEREAGTIPIGGVAWAPHRGIQRVEVSTDDGETWNDARLAEQLDEDTWRQYVYEWEASPGEHTIKVRATDGEGETQPEEETAPHPSGASGYDSVKVSVA